MRRFAWIGGLDAIPDEATILNFRRLLETHGLAGKLFKKVNAHIQRKGLSMRSGTIVDATIIAAQARRRIRTASATRRCARRRRETRVPRDEGAHRRG
jgi:IS5 family transposase